jgi:NIPSNAP protein
MDAVRYPIVELRQYTLVPGGREVLIELFDRELVESQEAEGMAVVGQFRDTDDPGRFVWLRGFRTMAARARALAAFYGGPVWRAHAARANATMIDSDDVLLLRPVTPRSGFPAPGAARPPAGHAAAGESRILITIYHRDRPFDEAFAGFFERQARPVLAAAGATPLACLQTEPAENTFPALPVRTGENVFVWLARFPTAAHLEDHLHQIEGRGAWRERVQPALSAMTAGPPQRLRLAPTARSLLR